MNPKKTTREVMEEEARMNGVDYKPVTYEIYRMRSMLFGLPEPGVQHDLLEGLAAIRKAFNQFCEANTWPKPVAFDVERLDYMIERGYKPSAIVMPGEIE